MGILPFVKTPEKLEVDLDKALPKKLVLKRGRKSYEIELDSVAAWLIDEFAKNPGVRR